MKRFLFFLLVLLIASTASADKRRVKNTVTRFTFPVYNVTTGEFLTGASLDCETDGYSDSASGDGFADLAGAEAEVSSTGTYIVTATQAEMNFDYVDIKCTSSTTNAGDLFFTIDTRHGTVLTATGKLTAEAFSFRGVTTCEGTGCTACLIEDAEYIGLASGDVDADDQYVGMALLLYDTGGSLYAASCITHSENTCDSLDLKQNLASLHTVGDSYEIVTSEACRGNLEYWKGNTLAAVDTSGYPKVTIKDGTGQGEIDTSSGAVTASGSTAPDVVLSGTLPSQSGIGSTQVKLSTGGSTTSNFYKNATVVITGGTGSGQARRIIAYSTARVATLNERWITAPDATSTFSVIARPVGISNLATGN